MFRLSVEGELHIASVEEKVLLLEGKEEGLEGEIGVLGLECVVNGVTLEIVGSMILEDDGLSKSNEDGLVIEGFGKRDIRDCTRSPGWHTGSGFFAFCKSSSCLCARSAFAIAASLANRRVGTVAFLRLLMLGFLSVEVRPALPPPATLLEGIEREASGFKSRPSAAPVRMDEPAAPLETGPAGIRFGMTILVAASSSNPMATNFNLVSFEYWRVRR